MQAVYLDVCVAVIHHISYLQGVDLAQYTRST